MNHSQQLPFTPDDFSLQARSALTSLQHVMQVVINAGVLLEQGLGRPLEPAAPRRFLYPREPEKAAATPKVSAAPAGSATEPVPEPSQDGPEAQLLRALHARPPTALFDTQEAAIYLRCRPELLRSWRWKQRGPRHQGSGRLVRYRKAALDDFLAT
jgi:hypothetical protein